VFVLLCIVGPALGQPADPKPVREESGIAWYDIRDFGIEGQGWNDTAAPFDRLPARAEKTVRPPVWNLSRNSTGLCVRFVTESTEIRAKWTLTSKNLAMPHMPATGVSGLDLYYRDEKGAWRWLANGRPAAMTNVQTLATGIPTGKREYLLYLPLYNGVSAVEVGIPKGNSTSKAADYSERRYFPRVAGERPAPAKPIVFYGTSITQGGCASRPGMVHTAILQRRLDVPVINLGFSGNGTMDLPIAELMAEVDASVYVIDCLPNMNAKQVEERADEFVRTLLRKRPNTPIVLVEDRSYSNATLLPGARERNRTNREALKKVYDRLIADKAGGVHYIKGDTLLGSDDEGTVDSSHPTDLGFVRQADAMQKVIEPLLPPIKTPNRPIIEGYTHKLSYVPGEEVQIHVSSSAKSFQVNIDRIGANRERVLRATSPTPGYEHAIPADASSNGCRWPVAHRFTIPNFWKSGYYVAQLTEVRPDNKVAIVDVPFVVRSADPGKDTKILLQLSTNTYNAYTNWGGYSLYAYHGRNGVQGRRVSFDRPISSQFNTWELPFVQWAEKAGYTIDYAVNSDLEFHPEILKHYKLVLSVGHDEYWSAPMRDNLEKFIADGGNVAFFSGNTCCWQVRSEDKVRALVCYKQAFRDDPLFAKGDQKLLSSLWSHHLVKRPENELTGVGFLHGGYHKSHGQYMDGSGAYTIHRPEHWLFEGTNLKKGEALGGKDTIVGYECDGCELTWKDGVPTPTYRDGTPKTFQVLATAPAKWAPDDCEWYERWTKGHTGNAVVGVYTRGGTVVTVGSTDWSHGLRGQDPAVMRITKNVLEKLGK
jgi:hypothetical protein